jgi:hypothetical protein
MEFGENEKAATMLALVANPKAISPSIARVA